MPPNDEAIRPGLDSSKLENIAPIPTDKQVNEIDIKSIEKKLINIIKPLNPSIKFDINASISAKNTNIINANQNFSQKSLFIDMGDDEITQNALPSRLIFG